MDNSSPIARPHSHYSSVGSWKEKIGDIDLIELYINTYQILRMDFKWVDETLDTLQSYVQVFT